MDMLRRGFLKGMAGMIATPLLMQIVDVLPATAITATPPSNGTALWTPESSIIAARQPINQSVNLPRMEAMWFALGRMGQDQPIVRFGLSLRGSMRWVALPGEELIIDDGVNYGSVADVFISYQPLG